jgi:predicted transglutaminase-like cysteine proteinase
LRALQAVWATVVQADDAARLQAINDFFNQRIAFRDDMAVWGQVDYWASPFEFLEKGEGDCEDFAIAKYFSLLVAGVPVHKLRLVYVRAQLDGPSTPAAMRPTAQGQATAQPQAHMVLAYYASPDAEPLILDNLEPEVRLASRRADLTPVFSFNSQGLWQGPGLQRVSDPAAGLSRWRDVMAKARAEGFGR